MHFRSNSEAKTSSFISLHNLKYLLIKLKLIVICKVKSNKTFQTHSLFKSRELVQFLVILKVHIFEVKHEITE